MEKDQSSSRSSDGEIEKENFELFLRELKSNLQKGKFKKVLEDIEVGEQKYSTVLNKWHIVDVKINTLIKIFFKHFFQNDTSIIKDYINVDNFLTRLDRYVDDWLDVLFINESVFTEDEFKIQLEVIISCYLSQLYSYSLTSKREKKCGDCCAYLGIAEKLIKYYVELTKNNKILYISSQILLFISSLLISDEEYLTAETYQTQSIFISFRLISYLNLDSEFLNLEKLSRSSRIYAEKAILTICVAFYQRGICEEALGNLFKATESYLQAKWFSTKFLMDSYPELVQFFTDVDTRVSHNAKLVKRHNQVDKKRSLEDANKNKKLLEKLNEMDFLKLEYNDTIQKIEKLKFPEFDEEKRNDHKVQEILYTVRMTNNLMSDKFKNIVLDLDRLDLHKMDKETKEIINKKLIQVRAKEKYEKYCLTTLTDKEKKNNKSKF